MAKGIYVGVDGIAHKAKKAYLGADSKEKNVEFTSNPMPTTWADSTDYLSATAINEYGEWKVQAETVYPDMWPASGAFDAGPSTYYRPEDIADDNTAAPIELSLPKGVSIKPSVFTSTYMYCSGDSKIYGYNGSEWVRILKMAAHSSNKTETNNVTTEEYFSKFRIELCRESSSRQPRLYAFEITEGTLKVASKPNIARKVKKGYVGVAGVARLFFSSERKLEYYGNAPALGTGRKELAGASSPNHAIFAGGENSSSTKFDATDAYDKNLVKATIDVLAKARSFLGGASNPNYAVFAGGRATSYTGNVDGYDVNLVRTTATSLSKSRHRMGATSVGNYACFGGGLNSDAVTNVDFYDTSLTRTYLADGLTTAVQFLSGSNTPNYALFAGGYTRGTDDCQSQVIAFSSNLTKSTPTGLTTARYKAFGVGVGNYALFAGGGYYQKGNYSCNDVDAYNDNLVKVTVDSLSFNTTDLKGVGINREFAIIVKNSGQVDMYNADLVKTSINNSLKGTGNPTAGASIGDYGLICGYGSSNIVDVYQAV